jgi:ribonuclease HI
MKIYCDGACQPNPGSMGIGLYFPDLDKRFSYALGEGTNQIAELAALSLAIGLAASGDVVCSDSQYAIHIALGQWKAKKHKPLVAYLQAQLRGKRMEVRWVRGHNGHPEQEEADRLAESAAGNECAFRVTGGEDEKNSSVDSAMVDFTAARNTTR